MSSFYFCCRPSVDNRFHCFANSHCSNFLTRTSEQFTPSLTIPQSESQKKRIIVFSTSREVDHLNTTVRLANPLHQIPQKRSAFRTSHGSQTARPHARRWALSSELSVFSSAWTDAVERGQIARVFTATNAALIQRGFKLFTAQWCVCAQCSLLLSPPHIWQQTVATPTVEAGASCCAC